MLTMSRSALPILLQAASFSVLLEMSGLRRAVSLDGLYPPQFSFGRSQGVI